MGKSSEICIMVIFGGSGDLARRKLVPALYNLMKRDTILDGFTILGISRSPLSDEEYRERLRSALEESGTPPEISIWLRFSAGIHYLSADYHSADTYERIKAKLAEHDAGRGATGNRLYYLAAAPSDYEGIIRNLGNSGLARGEGGAGWARVIIEKPFGQNLDSAIALNRVVAEQFQEEHVYRIDHYLGKETVQNLLVFRFANGIFEPLWNRQYVDSIQITAAEDIGVGTRASYYEQAGALRDMIQNHVLQLLTLVAMEPPPDFTAKSVRDEKIKVLRSIRPIAHGEVAAASVRGQYGRGFISGKPVPAYREEKGVSPDSKTETYVAIRFLIENWRWAGVPFYVRTGKNLAKHVTEISIQFRRTPHWIFRQSAFAGLGANVLSLRIQPDEGIGLKFFAKEPGQSMHIQPVVMNFGYRDSFGFPIASAYERLLLDCFRGDPTLFNRADSVETAWALVQPFLDVWAEYPARNIPCYDSGAWGPREADELLERENRSWCVL